MYSTFSLEELLAEKDRLVQYAIKIDETIFGLIEMQTDPVYDAEMLQEEINDRYDDLAWVNIDMDAVKEELDRRG